MKKLSPSEIKDLPVDDLIAYVESITNQIYRDFNNFHLHFIPGGYRCVPECLENWNALIISPQHFKRSDVATSQTYNEFYKTLDRVVEEVSGIAFSDFLEQLTTVLESIKSSKGATKEQEQKKADTYFALLNPVRERLYILGYNWNDLCR